MLSSDEVNDDECVSNIYQMIVLKLQRLVEFNKSSLAHSKVLDEVRVLFNGVFYLEMSASVSYSSLSILRFDEEVVDNLSTSSLDFIFRQVDNLPIRQLAVRSLFVFHNPEVSNSIFFAPECSLESLSVDTKFPSFVFLRGENLKKYFLGVRLALS